MSPPTAARRATSTRVIDSHDYYLQDEFADADPSNSSFDGCEQRPGGANDGVSSSSEALPVTYHKGPVVGAHTAYVLFWDPPTTLAPSLSASFSASTSTAHIGQAVTFIASVSNPGGGALTYNWGFGDGSSATTSVPTVTHAYISPGSHTVTLTVTSGGVSSQPAQQTVYVFEGPVVSFIGPAGAVREGVAVPFDASATRDPDGTITTWTWSFGDESGAAGPLVSHAFAHPGSYTVTLTVVDQNDSIATGSAPVQVSPRPRAAARISKSGRVVLVIRHGRVLVRTGHNSVRCAAGGPSCTVSIKLSARIASPGRSTDERGHAHTVTIGVTKLTVLPGGKAPAEVTLNQRGVTALRSLRRLRATLAIDARTPEARATRASGSLTLIAPARLPP